MTLRVEPSPSDLEPTVQMPTPLGVLAPSDFAPTVAFSTPADFLPTVELPAPVDFSPTAELSAPVDFPPSADLPATVVLPTPVDTTAFEPPEISITPTIVNRAPAPRRAAEAQGNSLTSTLMWALAVVVAFALIGGGAGYLVFHFSQTKKPSPQPAANNQPVAANPSPPPTPDIPDDQVVTAWRRVGQWRGTGPLRTPIFRVTKSRWRIQWTATARDPSKPDNFALHVTDGIKQLKTPVSIVGSGSSTTDVRLKPGRYMLEIFTFGTDWEVTLEEPE